MQKTNSYTDELQLLGTNARIQEAAERPAPGSTPRPSGQLRQPARRCHILGAENVWRCVTMPPSRPINEKYGLIPDPARLTGAGAPTKRRCARYSQAWKRGAEHEGQNRNSRGRRRITPVQIWRTSQPRTQFSPIGFIQTSRQSPATWTDLLHPLQRKGVFSALTT